VFEFMLDDSSILCASLESSLFLFESILIKFKSSICDVFTFFVSLSLTSNLFEFDEFILVIVSVRSSTFFSKLSFYFKRLSWSSIFIFKFSLSVFQVNFSFSYSLLIDS
jgi:hypothetical protein